MLLYLSVVKHYLFAVPHSLYAVLDVNGIWIQLNCYRFHGEKSTKVTNTPVAYVVGVVSGFNMQNEYTVAENVIKIRHKKLASHCYSFSLTETNVSWILIQDTQKKKFQLKPPLLFNRYRTDPASSGWTSSRMTGLALGILGLCLVSAAIFTVFWARRNKRIMKASYPGNSIEKPALHDKIIKFLSDQDHH